jgi:hypothetical protein
MTSKTFGNLAVVRAIAAVQSAARALHDWEQTQLRGDDLSIHAEWEDQLNELIAVERRARDELIRQLVLLDLGDPAAVVTADGTIVVYSSFGDGLILLEPGRVHHLDANGSGH